MFCVNLLKQKEPEFPPVCAGCTRSDQLIRYQPEDVSLLFLHMSHPSWKNSVPKIELLLCENCHHSLQESLQNHWLSHHVILFPAGFIIATLIFYFSGLQAVAVLTGIGCLGWILFRLQDLKSASQALLLELRPHDLDHISYCFRDSKYAELFAQLNQARVQKDLRQ